MDDSVCFLITLTDGVTILKCALKIDDGRSLPFTLYPMEPENKAKIAALLPEYVRSFGNIVDIEEIFDICIRSGS